MLILARANPVLTERLEKLEAGVTVFKADQCPYTSGNAKAVEEIAKQAGLLLRTVRAESRKQAQNGFIHTGLSASCWMEKYSRTVR